MQDSTVRHEPSATVPAISVGLPVYNGERYVGVTIESVLAQTFVDFELVIVDNASTDRTPDICREYAERDSRVRYVRNPVNIGVGKNYCCAFSLAKGGYFRWLSADDYIAPTALERCKDVLDQRADVVLCCTKANIVDEHGAVIGPYETAQALECDNVFERFRRVFEQYGWCHTVYGLLRRDVVQRTALIGSFPGSDCTLLAELSLYGRFAEVDEYLFFRRTHPQAYSHKPSRESNLMYFAPQERRKPSLVFQVWRHLYEHIRAIGRAPLSVGTRLLLWLHVLRMAWWKRRALGTELWEFTRTVLARDHVESP